MTVKATLTHIAFCVKNIEDTAAFYKKYAGLDVVSQRKEHNTRVAWLGNPRVNDRLIIVLLEMPFQASEAPSFHHIGMQVDTAAEVDRLAGLARDEGILRMEPSDHGPVAGYLCIIRDPDGNGVEFSFGQEVVETLSGCGDYASDAAS
ncbi:MAG: VOC family protein [bacterium]|nr:VOC family protein [bacterium]